MSVPNFTAQAAIENYALSTHHHLEIANHDSSIKIEPAQHYDPDLVERCHADGCIATEGGKMCRGWNCSVFRGGYWLYNYYQSGWHFIHSDWGPISEP